MMMQVMTGEKNYEICKHQNELLKNIVEFVAKYVVTTIVVMYVFKAYIAWIYWNICPMRRKLGKYEVFYAMFGYFYY